MPQRHATTSMYQVIFIVFALCPSVSPAPAGGSSGDSRANATIIAITVFSLVIVLALGASLAYCFPLLLPVISRRFHQTMAPMNHCPLSMKKHNELDVQSSTTGRLSNESEATMALVNPTPSRSPAQSISLTARGREISSPLSIIFDNHPVPTSNQSSQTPESQIQHTPRTSIESIPGETEDQNDTLDILIITHTEDNATQVPSEMNEDDTPSRDHLPTPEETPLPQSPAPSTRPPTYYTDASRDSMSTLPLYQENEENEPPRRRSSTRSRSIAAARRLPRPPLPPRRLSYPFKS